MSIRTMRAALAALCTLLPVAAIAADLIPVEDFARHTSLSMPRLSPDGQYIALAMADGDHHALVIYRTAEMSKPSAMLRMPKFELPAGIEWVSSTRLVIEVGKEYGSVDKPTYTGELIATDVDR
ncbi:MAG: hypothetical protein WA777_09560 [Rhodanobacter sp.]